LSANQPTWDRLATGDGCVSPVAARGERLIIASQSAAEPCRLAVIDSDDRDPSPRLLPTALDEATIPTPSPADVRRFTVPSPIDSALLEGWFLSPPGAALRLATVVVHGGPMAAFGECFSFDAQVLCAAGFGVLYTNPHGSTGYGDAFTHSVIGDWAGAPVADVLAVIDHAVGLGWVNDERVGVRGNSYGGYLSAWMACTTTLFRAAVVENPVTGLLSMYGTSDIGGLFLPAQLGSGPPTVDIGPYLRSSPILHAHECRTPVLFVVGDDDDRRCPPGQAFELHRALHAVGTPSEVLVLPGASHEGSTFGPVACRLAHDHALVEWMSRWLIG
jgi:dipeptidyl aminopeptidase/acylaminoacyl peptidase